MSFDSLGLSADLLRAVKDQGYTEATPVQTQAIPVVLAGHDLMAGAQTGTGKTAAFTLPMLQNLMNSASGKQRRIRALVLTPTRELADQVSKSVRTYGRHLPLRSTEVYGGMGMYPQINALRKGVDILVATPGRLLDHMDRGNVDLSQVEMLILDEGDRMLDMGFLPDIERVLKEMPATRQTLLFSATYADGIKKLARKLLKDPQLIEVDRSNAAARSVTQSAYRVDGGRKRQLLSHLIDSESWGQVLIFTRTKRGADRLSEQLDKDGIKATAIHGDKSQGARNRALKAFKRQSVQALVATDVAARGLDIQQLPHVVNYELPHNPEDYVHRIGRTGRGGNKGAAISLVSADEDSQFRAIKRLLDTDIPAIVLDGFEPRDKAKPAARPRKPFNKKSGAGPKPYQGRKGKSTSGDQARGGPPRRKRSGQGRAASAC